MMSVLLVFSVAVLALALAVYMVYRGYTREIHSVDQLTALSQPIDLPAFRNLVDRDEELFLRENVSAPDFRRVQRLRMLAAADYIRRIAHNAGVLLRFASVLRQSADPVVARAANELADTALSVRMYSIIALAKVYFRAAFPNSRVSSVRFADRYETLREHVAAVTRMKSPASVTRVEQSL